MEHSEVNVRKMLARERANDQRLAAAFATACASGSVEEFYRAVDGMHSAVDGWRLAMRRVGKLENISEEIRHAFLPVWIESKMLPLRVGHRPTLAAALRKLLPRNYLGPALIIYRGACAQERRRRLYGFSWSESAEIAERFAGHWASASDGGLILRTSAPAEAILHARSAEEYYDEDEIIVDPFALNLIEVVKRIDFTMLPKGHMDVDLHGCHPDDIDFSEIFRQAWETGATSLTLIHGHGRGRGIFPGFVNTNTGYLGLHVRRVIRADAELRQWVKVSTIDCTHNGSTTIKLKSNPTPTRTAIDPLLQRYARGHERK